MWFKKLSLFKINDSMTYQPEALGERLEAQVFTECRANLPMSLGWASPIDQDGAPLVHAANGFIMICLNVEEKVIPAQALRRELDARVKEIEAKQDRKVFNKEKANLRDDVYFGLLPRALSKLSKIYAFIDTHNQWLFVEASSSKQCQLFIDFLLKTIPELKVKPCQLENVSSTMTRWLLEREPNEFEMDESCVLKDPNKQGRVIRAQQQDVHAPNLQAFLKDGLQVSQIKMTWQERVTFNLNEEFIFQSIKYQDTVIEMANEVTAEDVLQQFDTDFVIMTDTLTHLLSDLMPYFKASYDGKALESENESQQAVATP